MGYDDILTLENDWLLQQGMFEGFIATQMGKKFEWLDFAPKQRAAGAESVTWAKEVYNADNDPNRRFPKLRTTGSGFVRAKVSGLTEDMAVLAKWGFEFTISEKARRYKTNLDVLERSLKRHSNWMGEWQNARIIGMLINADRGVTRINSSDQFYNRTVKKWNVAGSNPVADMILIQGDMEDNEGYNATDWYVSKKKFEELRMFLVTLDVDMPTRQGLYGVPQANVDSVFIPALGGTVHKVRYGLADGDILCLDRGLSPMTLYYDFNPEYGPSESFELENGQTLDNDFGLHTHQYKDDKTHELVKQIWCENIVAVKDATAGLFCPNGSQGI